MIFNMKKTKVDFWFMLDSFMFIPIKGTNLREITLEFIKVAKKHPYGMICPVEIKGIKIGKCVHVDKHGNFDIKEYFQELLKDKTIRKIFNYGR